MHVSEYQPVREGPDDIGGCGPWTSRVKSSCRRIEYVIISAKSAIPIKTRFGRYIFDKGRIIPEMMPNPITRARPVLTSRYLSAYLRPLSVFPGEDTGNDCQDHDNKDIYRLGQVDRAVP